jgi:glycosyltransferase involved in cell wall biosynthesis
MKGFDLLVRPSTHEGFPNAVLEALRISTPAIGSSAGGSLKFYYRELLFEPRDVSEIAAKIGAFLTNDEACERARA